MAELPKIDVCLATYKRPGSLERLLRSLLDQETQNAFQYSIIVVDNDKLGTAQTVVGSFKGSPIEIIYDIEPNQNIALARNRALQHLTGQYIATIDDDEEASGRWLLSLFRALQHYRAEVVIGRVVSVFPEGAADLIKDSRVFNLPAPPTGSNAGFIYSTNNCLMKRELINGFTNPFDPALGLTGGSDAFFFGLLKRRAVKIVFCREAVVRESIPENRTTLRWLLKRFFRNGHITYIKAKKGLDKSPALSLHGKRNKYIKSLTYNAFVLIVLQFQWLFTKADNRKASIETMQNIAFNCGFLLSFTGLRYHFYRQGSDL